MSNLFNKRFNAAVEPLNRYQLACYKIQHLKHKGGGGKRLGKLLNIKHKASNKLFELLGNSYIAYQLPILPPNKPN